MAHYTLRTTALVSHGRSTRRPGPVVTLIAFGVLLALPTAGIAAVQCQFEQVVGIAFGNYDTEQPVSAAGWLTFVCTGVGWHTVVIELSRGSSSSYQPRALRNGAAALPYNLYLDPAANTIWGDGTGGSDRLGPMSPPNNRPVTVTIYGRIPAGVDVPAGVYGDVVTATLLY